MKIAIVYDRINKLGGAERVLIALHEIWPDAPLYTAVYNSRKAVWADVFSVHPSFINRLPLSSSLHEFFPLLTPMAFESFNFDDFDVVLSVTSADAKGILTKSKTLHICYCLTPTRYLWSGYIDYLNEPGMGFLNPLARIFIKIFATSLRKWDYLAAQRPDKFIAISQTVKKRINTYYKRESEMIYPPVDTQKFQPAKYALDLNYFLIVSRLVPYKKIDYVIRVFNELGWKLKIIGTGIDENRLKNMSRRNIEFLGGDLTDEKLSWYYQNCTAFIFPGEEDFGIAAVETQACGKPVIGLIDGGAGEIVISGKTGELYSQPNESSLIHALKKAVKKEYSFSICRKNALKFSKRNFQKQIKNIVENEWNKWQIK